MRASSKAVIIALVVGIGLFGYSQYASASQIGVSIVNSEFLGEDERGSSYDVELQFDNPSLLILTAGPSEFFVIVDGNAIGQGQLEPFVLPALGSASAAGSFQTSSELDRDNPPPLKITGLTKYDVLFGSVEIPFVFHPTEEQTRKFIDGG